jgi:serine/threonine protein kinase
MVTDTHQYKAKNCTKGIPCGNACISASKKCKSKLPSNVSASLDAIADPNNLEEGAQTSGATDSDSLKILDSPPESVETIGKGAYGEVYLTPTGTAYKTVLDKEQSISKEEIEIMNDASKLGIAPKLEGVYSDEKGEAKGFEMEFLKDHIPLSKVLEGNSSDQDRADIANSMTNSFAKLHDSGILHLDVHAGNILTNQGGAKIIDYGLSIKFNAKDPSDQDLKRWGAEMSRMDMVLKQVNPPLDKVGGTTKIYTNAIEKLSNAKETIDASRISQVREIYKEFNLGISKNG